MFEFTWHRSSKTVRFLLYLSDDAFPLQTAKRTAELIEANRRHQHILRAHRRCNKRQSRTKGPASFQVFHFCLCPEPVLANDVIFFQETENRAFCAFCAPESSSSTSTGSATYTTATCLQKHVLFSTLPFVCPEPVLASIGGFSGF